MGLITCILSLLIIIHKNRLCTVHPLAYSLIELVFGRSRIENDRPVSFTSGSVTLRPRKPSTEVKGTQTEHCFRWNINKPRTYPCPTFAGVFQPTETAETHRNFWLRERREDKGLPSLYHERHIYSPASERTRAALDAFYHGGWQDHEGQPEAETGE